MENARVPQDECQPLLRLKSESEEVVYYSALYEGLPEEFKNVAKTELNETDENRKKGMTRLKEIARKETLENIDDDVLLVALRSGKFNLKKAEAKLLNLVAGRKLLINHLAKLDLAKVEMILDDMPVGMLPYRDRHGRVILFSRPYGANLEQYDIQDVLLVGLALVFYLISYPLTTVSGIVYFGECDTPSLYIFYPIFKSFKRFLSICLCFAFRIARIEVLNELHIVRFLINVMRPVLPEKINKRFFLHGAGYDNLHKHYDPRILPDVFGGSMGSLSNKCYRQKVLGFIRELKAEGQENASRD